MIFYLWTDQKYPREDDDSKLKLQNVKIRHPDFLSLLILRYPLMCTQLKVRFLSDLTSILRVSKKNMEYFLLMKKLDEFIIVLLHTIWSTPEKHDQIYKMVSDLL